MTAEKQEMGPLSVLVHESISVSEAVIVGIIIERLTTWSAPKGDTTVVSITEYRKLVGDYKSGDERIKKRLEYLEAFCRNIIKPELQKIYVQSKENVRR